MLSIGVRELRNGLSRYLRRVAVGETILVTDRGRPVARILPAATPDDIAGLIAGGRASWLGGRFVPPARPVRPAPGPPLSEYVAEDRG